MNLEQTWRWYGPNDPVTLNDIRQAGATGIVTALHEVPIGEVWTEDAILERKRLVEWDDSKSPAVPTGLTWSVIESIPVHEAIKLGKPARDEYIEKYREGLRNVGRVGIRTVCYNFMPVVDWTRTNLSYELEDGSKALAFNIAEFAAFDLFILKRLGAEADYNKEVIEKADELSRSMTREQKTVLRNNITAGLPGAQQGYSLEQLRAKLDEYRDMTDERYRENLYYFLRLIIPVAEEADVKMAIHPDDPPIPLFGLPRIVSTERDYGLMFNAYDSVYNGFTLCSGSLGVRADNDLLRIAERFGDRLNFAHLRSTQRDDKGNFYETSHLKGDVDMYALMLAILREQKRRLDKDPNAGPIPIRPDHGHLILDDLRKKTNPGYSAIGRLKGLAELRGLEMGILKSGVIDN
jgi:mannonate dehydratase